jgi:hypothetical protein
MGCGLGAGSVSLVIDGGQRLAAPVPVAANLAVREHLLDLSAGPIRGVQVAATIEVQVVDARATFDELRRARPALQDSGTRDDRNL